MLGPPHFDRYEFLLAVSDHFGDIGLEHHRSSENRRPPNYFIEWDKVGAGRDLLPHEFSHSWNGKFRRPAGLATPDFNAPMHNSLLWVYEGLTNYLGAVLAVRSGLWSEDFGRQSWASLAANMDRNRAGRTVARSRGYDGAAAHHGAPAAVVAVVAADRGLLHRRRALVARYRYAHSRAHPRQEVAG